jgi:hypothetical protein
MIMTEPDKLLCPDCNVEMNHHATKIEYAAELAEGEDAADADTGGVLQEAHTCPACGRTHLRRSESFAG